MVIVLHRKLELLCSSRSTFVSSCSGSTFGIQFVLLFENQSIYLGAFRDSNDNSILSPLFSSIVLRQQVTILCFDWVLLRSCYGSLFVSLMIPFVQQQQSVNFWHQGFCPLVSGFCLILQQVQLCDFSRLFSRNGTTGLGIRVCLGTAAVCSLPSFDFVLLLVAISASALCSRSIRVPWFLQFQFRIYSSSFSVFLLFRNVSICSSSPFLDSSGCLSFLLQRWVNVGIQFCLLDSICSSR